VRFRVEVVGMVKEEWAQTLSVKERTAVLLSGDLVMFIVADLGL
jgi:hypothetical protein